MLSYPIHRLKRDVDLFVSSGDELIESMTENGYSLTKELTNSNYYSNLKYRINATRRDVAGKKRDALMGLCVSLFSVLACIFVSVSAAMKGSVLTSVGVFATAAVCVAMVVTQAKRLIGARELAEDLQELLDTIKETNRRIAERMVSRKED